MFVRPEYNHGPSGALKNAIDFLYKEWNNQAAGFVSYGEAGGVRAVEQLRLVMAEVQIADVRAQVGLSLVHDFERFTTFRPAPTHEAAVQTMFDQLVAWGTALRALRKPASALRAGATARGIRPNVSAENSEPAQGDSTS